MNHHSTVILSAQNRISRTRVVAKDLASNFNARSFAITRIGETYQLALRTTVTTIFTFDMKH